MQRKTSLHVTYVPHVMSPIAHPELTENGIEYAWAFSKLHLRRTNQQKGFTKGIPACIERFSLCCGVVCRSDSGYDCFHGLEQTHKFARRARDHARIYRGEYSVASIIDIERIRKKKKSHHSALDRATSSFRSASRVSLTKPRRLLSVCWKLNNIRIQQQQRDSPY